jgi:CHAT domain-containing protein/tetratricopeptide (TPR) repeat protein
VQGNSSAALQVRELIEAGRFEDAERIAQSAASSASLVHGVDSLEAAVALDDLVEALLLNGRGALPVAREQAERALRIKERQRGPSDPSLPTSLTGLANVLLASGDAATALPLFERALAIRERTMDVADGAIADALEALARGLFQADRYDDAKKALDRALQLRERSVASHQRAVAGTLEQLAALHQRRGEYNAARPLLERALSIREGPLRDTHPGLVGTWNAIGLQCFFEGDARAEEDAYRRALAVAETSLRPGHPSVAATLKNLSYSRLVVGDLMEARSILDRALTMAEESYGPTHPETAEFLNDLANVNRMEGRHLEARVLYERAAGIVEKRPGASGLALATYLHNLALLDARLGDYLEARRNGNRAVALWRRIVGPDHPFVARAQQGLAVALLEQQRYVEAQYLLEQVLRIRERTLKADHLDLASTLAYLARALEGRGQRTRARALSARAVGVLASSTAPELLESRILSTHASMQLSAREFDSARTYYERALAITRSVYGADHPELSRDLVGLAAAEAGLAHVDLALDTALRAGDLSRRQLRLTLRSLPERQSLAYVAANSSALDLALTLRLTAAGSEPKVLEAVVASRALVLDAIATRVAALGHETGGEIGSLRRSLVAATQRLANLLVRGPDPGRSKQYLELVADARREAEARERLLASRSSEYLTQVSRDDIGLSDIVAAMPPNAAIVSFNRYQHSGAPAVAKTSGRVLGPPEGVPSYVGFVLRPSTAPAMVSLGPAEVIDTLVRKWRSAVIEVVAQSPATQGAPLQSSRAVGARLRRLVWDPLLDHLHGIERVFIVPDGSLSLVPFAALPTGQRSYLLETGPMIHYLSAERDVVPVPASTRTSIGLFALGGPSFDDSSLFRGGTRPVASPMPSSGSAILGGAAPPCGGFQSITFQPLAGTRVELRDLSAVWHADPFNEEPARVLVGREASETAFKRDAPGHRVLHLATHGFFLNGECAFGPTRTRGVGGLATARPTTGAENPLRLSGLALAGANRRAQARPDEDDGILTAEEVAMLDLQGVEWAVLSACDTGVGEVRAGEGVFGLRRAFQVAGARTVIMSLWSVDDRATRDWMRALYEGRFQRNLSTADAVHQASLTVLRDRRARGLSTHPFYWAAFVAAGDWR